MANCNSHVGLAFGLIAGTTGLVLGLRGSRQSGELEALVKDLVKNKHALNAAQKKSTSRNALLPPHKARLLRAYERTQEMLTFCCASEDPLDRENISGLEERLKQMEKASKAIDSDLEKLQQLQSSLAIEQDFLFEQLASAMSRAHRSSENNESDSIPTEMFLPEELDSVENDLSDFADFLESQKDEQGGQQIELVRDEFETEQMMDRFVELKRRKEGLETTELTSASDEMETISAEMSELADQLCLRGVPVRNGSIVLRDLVPIDDARPDVIIEETPDNRPSPTSALPDARASIETQAPRPLLESFSTKPQATVFDWSQFEQPPDRKYGYDEAPEVAEPDAKERQEDLEREYDRYVDSNTTSILTWLQNITTDPQLDPTTLADEEQLQSPYLPQLRDIEVGEWCFDVYDRLSEYEMMANQMRMATLFRRSREMYRTIVEAELDINPDLALPHDWQDYVEREYETEPGDTHSKPWV